MTTTKDLTERLAGMAGEVPDVTEVVELATPGPEALVRRNEKLLGGLAEAAGVRLDPSSGGLRLEGRTVYRGEDGGRAVTFHASGALSLHAGVDPLDDLFDEVLPDEKLRGVVGDVTRRLGLASLVNREDSFTFERLWKLKAAGADPEGRRSDPVLTRAVGAYRHGVRELPVLGRASASVEVTGSGRLSSLTLSLRRLADDGSGATVDKAVTRRPDDAAAEVAARLSRLLAGREEDVRLDPQLFAFGYLSLGRRRSQQLLAPMYVAAVTVDGGDEGERSAHVVAVAGSEKQYLRLPVGVRTVATQRSA